MRSGWQRWVLLIVMFAIYWILVMPQVDLDPATPLNLEAFFFAVVAISVLLGSNDLYDLPFRKVIHGLLPFAQAPPVEVAAWVAPLRV
ncbi:hypothetical protein Acid345_3991 [Candidatus Koribacter versatilis Ellin345]|uniref:Uncharacterized protein n=1 Tax=Koribacter versatilis (strain Ellin345) TaxID=204669 RepID=Q1IJF9_KORVE|nr:hypothetical protein [Candidatus Koribacter versatilis]ABF42991.1 hypothetical protein Acid345_3991 [Candidatus Koribacter versatilis Ellin345]